MEESRIRRPLSDAAFAEEDYEQKFWYSVPLPKCTVAFGRTERNPITGVTTYTLETGPSPLANGADGPTGEMAKYPNTFSEGVSC
jgi:hypothetical protein